MAVKRFGPLAVGGLLAAMLLFGIGLGAIGYRVLFSDGSSSESVTSAPETTGSVAASASVTDSFVADEESEFDETPSNEATELNLQDIAEIKGAFARNAALHTFLAAQDTDSLSTLIAQTQEIQPKSLQASLRRPIILRLTMIDPLLALDSIKEFPLRTRDSLTTTIFGEWAQVSLDQSVAFAKSLDDVQQYAALSGILQSRGDLSEQSRREIAIEVGNEHIADEIFESEAFFSLLENPQKSWFDLVENLDDSSEAMSDLLNVATEWVRQSGLGVLNEMSDSLKGWSRKAAVLTAAVSRAAHRNPSRTVKQLLTMNEQLARTTAPTAIRIWTKSDPQSALSVATSVESSGLRTSLLKSVVSEWARSDANELLASIDSIPESVTGLAQERAVRALAKSDPVEAAHLFEALDLNSKEIGIAREIASDWSKSDPLAALEWVFNTPVLESNQGELLNSVLGNLAKSDPDLAMDLALQQPVELGLDVMVVSRLALVDPVKALDMLSQIRDSDHFYSAYTSVGSALVRIGQTERAITLASELSSFHRWLYYQSVFGEWARTDPEELLASIDKLPSSDAKSNAALALATQSSFTNSALTDEQIEYAKTFLNERDAKSLESSGTFFGFGRPSIRIVGDVSMDPGQLDALLEDLNQSPPDMPLRGPVVRGDTIIID